MERERLVVFWYHGTLAYASESEYENKLDYMYMIYL